MGLAFAGLSVVSPGLDEAIVSLEVRGFLVSMALAVGLTCRRPVCGSWHEVWQEIAQRNGGTVAIKHQDGETERIRLL